MDEILYVKVIDRDIVVRTESHYKEGPLTNQLESILTQFGFVRLHQNFIAKLDKIKSYDGENGIVYFDDEKLIGCQVSRRNKHKVLEYFYKKQFN